MAHKLTEEDRTKSHEARKANHERRRALRELLREELDKPVNESGLTKAEWLTAKMVQNLKDDITVDDYLKLQKVLGEDVIRVDVSADGLLPSERIAKWFNEMK